MTVDVNDVVLAVVEGEGVDGQDVQNAYHIRNVNVAVTDAVAITDLISLLEALMTLLAAVISTLYVVRSIKVINVTQQSDVGTGLFVDDTPGTNTALAMPPQCAVGLTLTTQRLSVRGRKFYGIVGSNQATNDGVLGAPAILDLADVGDLMVVNQVEAGTTWQFGVIASLDAAWLPFLSYAVTTSVITQKRRRRGVGS